MSYLDGLVMYFVLFTFIDNFDLLYNIYGRYLQISRDEYRKHLSYF